MGKKLYQHYKVFDIDNVCGDDSWNIHSYEAKTILIELKQNKEDMKTVKISKDDLNFLINKIRYGILPKHTDYNKITKEISKLFSIDNIEDSNSENIGKNLKPFDLEAAKAGKPVYTRDGRKARIVCFDRIDARPILALVPSTDGKGEDVFDYFVSGKRIANSLESDLDLMMLPEKKEGWVNIYKGNNGISKYDCGDIVFNIKEEAIQYAQNDDKYITTVKISWEE